MEPGKGSKWSRGKAGPSIGGLKYARTDGADHVQIRADGDIRAQRWATVVPDEAELAQVHRGRERNAKHALKLEEVGVPLQRWIGRRVQESLLLLFEGVDLVDDRCGGVDDAHCSRMHFSAQTQRSGPTCRVWIYERTPLVWTTTVKDSWGNGCIAPSSSSPAPTVSKKQQFCGGRSSGSSTRARHSSRVPATLYRLFSS
eukprot:3115677-Prymnesium_polylepis.2